MSLSDPTTAEIHHALSEPVFGQHQLSRRYFLAAAAAAGGAAMLPVALAEQAEAAVPLGATDGVLVLITMKGGNDGLNTLVPVDNGNYYDRRGGTALEQSQVRMVTANRGLHPNLGYLETLWQSGQVAAIEGAGDPGGNLSHFASTARWMAAKTWNGIETSGWMGRYIDGLSGGRDAFHGVVVANSLPLLARGNDRVATAVPARAGNMFDVGGAPDWQGRQYAAIDALASGSTGKGPWADLVAESGREALSIASQLAPVYSAETPEGDIESQLFMAARLINANLGIRIINVSYGDFDSHANHLGMHGDRMAELDRGLRVFYETLASQFADRTLLLTTSEFGRRLTANNGGGTDHGRASTLLAIGPGVVGGIFGQQPDLSSVPPWESPEPVIDFRQIYGNVLDRWLGADAGQVLGQDYSDLGFLRTPGAGGGGGGSTAPPTVANKRAQVARLYLAFFGRLPDTGGLEHWLGARRAGLELSQIAQAFAESPEFRELEGERSDAEFVDVIYRNVLGRAPDSDGRNYWAGELANGMSRGAMMIGFSESDEYVASTRAALYEMDSKGPVARLYRAYFRRDADAGGLAFWLDQDMPLSGISDAFAASDEFTGTYGALSNQQFVERVYENVLGRAPEQAGLEFWVAQIYAGMTRGQMMLNFSESPEYIESF